MTSDPTRPVPQQPDAHNDERRDAAPDPVTIGAGLRPVEDRLRRSLATEARAITPTDRLGSILTEARGVPAGAPAAPGGPGGPGGPGRRHRWLVPVAAAAATVLVAGGVWALTRPDRSTPPVAGTSPTAVATSASPSPSASGSSSVPTVSASRPSTATTPPPAATETVSVPVYYAGPIVVTATLQHHPQRLFREFVRTPVAAPAGPEARALAALTLAMGDAPASSEYVSAWAGVRPLSVSLADPGRIAVTLSAGLPQGSDLDPALAVQQLVWTAQAAVGRGALPVVVSVQGGGDVAPGIRSGQEQQRPADDMGVYEVLAPLWIDEPSRGETLPADTPVTVKGVASTFEANVEWQVLRGETVVQQGSTTATAGAPQRGTYSFRTKGLPAGDYVVRVLESSPKDGTPAADQRMPITVG